MPRPFLFDEDFESKVADYRGRVVALKQKSALIVFNEGTDEEKELHVPYSVIGNLERLDPGISEEVDIVIQTWWANKEELTTDA